jgi:hypothetical protein
MRHFGGGKSSFTSGKTQLQKNLAKLVTYTHVALLHALSTVKHKYTKDGDNGYYYLP